MTTTITSVCEQEVLFNRFVDNTNTDTLIDDIKGLSERFLRYCEHVDNMSPRTIPTRRTHLRQFAAFCHDMNWRSPADITLNHIDFYFYQYSRTHAHSTVNSGRRIMRSFLQWCADRDIAFGVSPESVKSRKNKRLIPRYIEHTTICRVVCSTKDRRAAFLVDFMYETGLRIDEVSRLRIEDIYGSALHVVGKGEKERTVPLMPEMEQKLGEYINGRSRGLVFGRSTSALRRWIQNAFMETVGTHVVPHQLRHSFAVRLLMSGCDLVTIQKLLGHGDISTTMIYLQIKDSLAERQFREAMAASAQALLT